MWLRNNHASYVSTSMQQVIMRRLYLKKFYLKKTIITVGSAKMNVRNFLANYIPLLSRNIIYF